MLFVLHRTQSKMFKNILSTKSTKGYSRTLFILNKESHTLLTLILKEEKR